MINAFRFLLPPMLEHYTRYERRTYATWIFTWGYGFGILVGAWIMQRGGWRDVLWLIVAWLAWQLPVLGWRFYRQRRHIKLCARMQDILLSAIEAGLSDVPRSRR